jgi:hypothetical protein
LPGPSSSLTLTFAVAVKGGVSEHDGIEGSAGGMECDDEIEHFLAQPVL